MKPTCTMRKALTDRKLLGKILDGPSWQAWRTLLIAAMGEALTDDERMIFTQLTGRAHEPLQRVEELEAVVGRRGGKSPRDGDARLLHRRAVQAPTVSRRAWRSAVHRARPTASSHHA